MATITAMKTANDAAIRNKNTPDSIVPADVANRLDAYADELLARGIAIAADTAALATLPSTDFIKVIVEGVGIFKDTATGPANGTTIFAGVGGRFWQRIFSTSSGSAPTANVVDYGAVGDGVTDDSAAFVAAIATLLPVEVPKGNFLVNTELILNDGQKIFGYGRDSNIVTSTNGSTADLNAAHNILQIFNNCTVEGLRFTGTGKIVYVFPFTSQNGIWVQGNNNLISNCFFINLRGSGILSIKTDLGLHSHNRSQGNYFQDNTIGHFNYAGSEYWTCVNNAYFQNNVNIHERGANNVHSGCSIAYATGKGILATQNGGNSDHSIFIGCTINHNSICMDLDGFTNGMQFIGCDFYGGAITIDECIGVIFNGCGFGNATTLTATAATAKVTLMTSCYFQNPFAPVAAGSAVITQANNIIT